MSKYTVELRFILENLDGLKCSKGYNSIDEIINNVYEQFWNFDMVTFPANHAERLQKAVLYHYYMREIGFETYGQFRLKLQSKLIEIMPKYTALYKIYDMDLDNPFLTHTETITSDRNRGTKTTSSSGSSSNDMQAYSDTPQGQLTGVQNLTYLTSATQNTGTQSANSQGSGSETDAYTETRQGMTLSKTVYETMQEFAEKYQSLDMRFIEEFEPLFMQLWG